MRSALLVVALPLAAACADPIPSFPYEGAGGRTTIMATQSSSSSSGGPVSHSVGTCSLANGLLHWYPGEQNPQDIVGATNGAWAPGTNPNYRPAKIGDGFVFDGTGYVQAAVTMAMGGPLTVDLWALSTAQDEGTFDATFSTGLIANAPFFQIDSDGSGNWRFFAQVSTTIGAIGLATWQHLAVTFDGTTVQPYLDGKPTTSIDWRGKQPLAFATLKIGANRDTNEFFKGTLDELHIWNRALTAAEVTELYELNGPALCP